MRFDTETPAWQLVPIIIGTVLLWPAVMAPNFWRAQRFYRVARRAVRYRHRIVADGVEVWSEGDTARQIPWVKLGAGRWVVHLEHTMASGFEETYAVDLPEEDVALGGYRGEIDLVASALSERGLWPEPQDGGKAIGAAGWIMTMVWFGAALLAFAVFHGGPF